MADEGQPGPVKRAMSKIGLADEETEQAQGREEEERQEGAEDERSDAEGSGAEGSAGSGDDGDDGDDGEGGSKGEDEDAKKKMAELEEDPPEDLGDWPGKGDQAMYETMAVDEEGYKDTSLEKLGPSSLRRYEDGSVEIEGEQVDNPDEYKGEPIPGGPTDPNAPENQGDPDGEGSDGERSDGDPDGERSDEREERQSG